MKTAVKCSLYVAYLLTTSINSDQRVTPRSFTPILWYPVEEESQRLQSESGLNAHDAFNIASGEVIARQRNVL